jgi:pimeloyl-ACP methyl ester carboxylesterase
VEVDGSWTFVRETPATSPDAEPALYVHGLGGSAQNWTDLAALLRPELDGQAIDLPGFGHSDAPPAGGYGQAALAARVIRWIEHSGRGPVHLFGNSLGGAITVRAAAMRPDLVRTLTLISPAMPVIQPLHPHGRMLPALMVPPIRRAIERRVRSLPADEMTTAVLDMCFADPSRVAPQRRAEAIEETVRRQQVPWAGDAYVGSLRGLAGSYLRPGNGSLWRLAARITAPTLVLWGRQDRIVDARLAPRTARLIPGSRLLVLDGVGHTAQMEVPRIVARAVLAFLRENKPTATV